MEELEYNVYIREKNKGLQVIVNYKDGLKWKQKSKQGFPNNREGKKEAKLCADKIVKTLKKEINLIHSMNKVTFESFKIDYLKHIKSHLAQNTIDIYENAFLLFKDLNELELKKIKNIDIQKIVDKLVRDKYKSSTITLYLSKLQSLFNYAVDNNFIATTPMHKIKFEKDKQSKEQKALTKSEYEILLSKIKNKKLYGITLLACYTGMRIGEILGLTWMDMDFANKLIKIDKQWVLNDEGIYTFGDLKSIHSYREIPMPDKVFKYFDSIYPKDLSKRIFPYKNTASASSMLIRDYKKYGFDISVHELRHTYATSLIAGGIDFKTAAKLLGHTVEMTMLKYSHVTSDMLENASKTINRIL